MDFITTDGFAPSGVKYPIFDGKEWISPVATGKDDESDDNGYSHCRFYCDYLYYLGRAISYEKTRGEKHPAWEAVFADGMRILKDVWKREGDFGMKWDVSGKQVRLVHRNTGAGAFALLALTEGLRAFPDDADLRRTALEAAEKYYDRCVASGRCGGGPKDILETDDSESIAALTDAFTKLYELTRDEKMLAFAVSAAHMFSSWVLAYAPPFPGGSPLSGINACGGVLANTQNRHIGPGICTNSARFLYDLGVYTGDERFIKLYKNILSAALNCITAYDGEITGESFADMFRKGMVSEQFNVYDVYSAPGHSWCVSASWPATSILLSDFDKPEGLRLD